MKTILMLVLGGIATLSALGQQQESMQPRSQPEAAQFMFNESINLVDEDSTTSRIDVPYRIDNQFFITIKNTDPSIPFPFVRRGEVLVELVDKDGVSKARDINRFTLGALTTDSSPDEKNWFHGVASFSIAPGEYSIIFEIDDLESERKFLERDKKIEAERFAGPMLRTSTPVFVQHPQGDTATLQNFGGNISFGSTASLFLQLYSDALTSDPVRVEYTISSQPFMFQDARVIASDTIDQLPLMDKALPVLLKQEHSTPAYVFETGKLSHTSALLIRLSAEKLPLRPFILEMKITQGTLSAHLKKPFIMVWPDMPVSLRDVDFALDALRHITREEELDSLQRGSRDARLSHLEEFWKQKDRTPGTDFNEVMVEYYRRVDHTLRTFSSMKGADGYKTDRGKIYILYGPPTRTERSLDPNAGYIEVWVYEKQNKRFVFRDQSRSGNYVLVATQNL